MKKTIITIEDEHKILNAGMVASIKGRLTNGRLSSGNLVVNRETLRKHAENLSDPRYLKLVQKLIMKFADGVYSMNDVADALGIRPYVQYNICINANNFSMNGNITPKEP